MELRRVRVAGVAGSGRTAKASSKRPARAWWSLVRVAGVAATVVLTAPFAVPFAASAVAAPTSKQFCAAIRVFNATRPTSEADLVNALGKFGRSAPADVKDALNAIVVAVHAGHAASVLADADNADLLNASTPAAAAGRTVAAAANQACHLVVDFQAVAPTGISTRSVPLAAWTRTVCAGLSDLRQKTRDAGSSLVTQANGVIPLADVRNALSQFLGTSVTTTEQLITRLGAAGIPKVSQGSAVAGMVHDRLDQARRTFLEAQPTAQALSDDPREFQPAAQALVQKIDNAGRQLGALVHDVETRFKVRVLDKTFAAEPACAGIA